jgi:hypothetical protein
MFSKLMPEETSMLPLMQSHPKSWKEPCRIADKTCLRSEIEDTIQPCDQTSNGKDGLKV